MSSDVPGESARSSNRKGTQGQPHTPLLTVDAVIELIDRPKRPIVLIQRRFPPYGWALPGGFVEVGETLEQATMREALEETGLQLRLLALLGCYSDPSRDPRGHTVSVTYAAQAEGQPVARDDAGGIGVFDHRAPPSPLAFDHGLILSDYRRWRDTGRCAAPRP
jgi:8-oxo-dGTP diphosphatase